MSDNTFLDDLHGLRTWSTAIRLWRLDGAEILSQYGLTWSGFLVLLVLLDGPYRSGQLCNELSMTTRGYRQLLKRLEEVGIIERRRGEEEYLRTMTIQLTTEGQALVETAGTAILNMPNADNRRWGISQDS
jgi:DNA-binding MarR family transcriptional regulator